MKNEERFSVHICTRNRNPYLAGVLQSLHTQSIQNWDVIIVDDASDKPVQQDKNCMDWVQFLRNNKHRVQVIRNPTRLLICKSRNLAIKMDDNDICCRIDDDSYLDPCYLEKLWRVITGTTEHQLWVKIDKEVEKILRQPKKIGAVGGIVPYLARGFGDGFDTFGYARNADKVKWFNHTCSNAKGNELAWDDMGHYHWWPDRIIKSHHLRSSYMFRKEAVQSVGGFEEWAGVTGFSEETVNCLKMLDKNWHLLTDTSAKAWHMVATGGGRDLCGRRYEDLVAQNKVKAKEVLKPVLKSLYKKKIITSRDKLDNRGTIIEI